MKRFNRMGLSAYASAAVILLALVASPSAARTLDCVPVTEDAVKQLFVRWNAALQLPQLDWDHPNPAAVVNLYAREAILLPTVENGPYTNPDAIGKYFEHFLKKQPSGVIDEATRTVRIGCNMAFDAGLYTFTYRKPDPPNEVSTKARYTYVYKYYDDGGWLIAHHHSSVWPVPPKP